MARSTNYTYDPKTGKWTKSTSDNSNSSNSSNKNNSNSSNSSSTNKTSNSDSSGDNLTSTSSDSNDSTGQVEKEYNDIQINTLEGTLNFIVTKETIKLKAGDTVTLKGLGKYLSGKYYVKELSRSIGSNGYSHSATVIKTDFGNSLKSKSKGSNGESVSSPPTSDNAKRTYTVKKGDCLWNIAKYYYGDGSKYTKIYDANTDKIADPDLIYVGQVLVIP